MSWIRVDQDLPDHHKSTELGIILNDDRAWTHVVQLWLWAARLEGDGDLSGVKPVVIARRAGWQGDPDEFINALRHVGFLDGFVLHDWTEYQAQRAEQARDRERKRLKRLKPSDGLPADTAGREPDSAGQNPPIPESPTPTGTGTSTGTGTKEEQVPVPPDGSTPAQVALIPEPPPVEKVKKRAAKAVKPPDDPQKRPDADDWTAAYKSGVPEADRVTLTQAFWVQWSATRKVEGIDRMLRSLKAILAMPRDKFPRNASPLVWVTTGFANGITASSTAPNAPTASRGAFPTPGVGSVRMPRNDAAPVPDAPAFDWTPAEALTRARARPAFAGPPTLFVPWGKSLPDDFQIPDDVVVEYLPDPGPKPLTFHDVIRSNP